MFVIKNYNRFVVNKDGQTQWEDFKHFRDPIGFRKLIKFDTRNSAQEFLDSHPELEEDFYGWIVELNPDDWSSFSSPWEPRR